MTGYCNRCGACCRLQRGGETYSCEHLMELGPPGENATLCAVHDARTHLMPIRMIAPSGKEIPEQCVPDFPVEGETNLPTGCTYRPRELRGLPRVS